MRKPKWTKPTRMADLYLAREELIAGTPVADEAAKRVFAQASRVNEKDVALLTKQIQKLLQSRTAHPQAGR